MESMSILSLHSLTPFYSGSSYFDFSGRRGSGTGTSSVILLKDHSWTTSPDPYVSVANPTDYDLQKMTVPPLSSDKDFHWNLGTSASDLPKSSTTTVKATDPSDGTQISAKTKINWHWAFEGAADTGDNSITQLPGSTVSVIGGVNGGTSTSTPQPKAIEQVQVGDKILVSGHLMRQTVTSITINPDTSITLNYDLDPDDDPTGDGYTETQQLERLHDATLITQHTGAKYVKMGLEGYVEVAKWPLYTVAGEAFVSLGGKALECAKAATKAAEESALLRTFASKWQVWATHYSDLATTLRQSGRSASEIVEAEQKAAQYSQAAKKCTAGADEAADAARMSQEMADEVIQFQKEVQAEQRLAQEGAGDFGGRLQGQPKKINLADDADTVRTTIRENQAARAIAKDSNFTIEQLLEKNPLGETNPDYSINGEIWDCISPMTGVGKSATAQQMLGKVVSKMRQAPNVVVNLKDAHWDLVLLRQVIEQNTSTTLTGLRKIIIITDDGALIRFWGF